MGRVWNCEKCGEVPDNEVYQEDEYRHYGCGSICKEVNEMAEMGLMDINGKHISVVISKNKKTLWVNTEEQCILRVHNVKSITVEEM